MSKTSAAILPALAMFGLCCAGIFGQNKPQQWQSLTGNLYRPGYWWTMRVDLPVAFIGSRDQLVARLADWQVVVSGRDIRSRHIFLSFPVVDPYPSFSLAIAGQSRIGRRLRLKPLHPNDYLVGIYAGQVVARTLPTLPLPNTAKIYWQTIDRLPTSCEALAAFNLIVIAGRPLSADQGKMLGQWVGSGGQLWLYDCHQGQPEALRSLLYGLRPDSTNDGFALFSIGLGTCVCPQASSSPLSQEGPKSTQILSALLMQRQSKRDSSRQPQLRDILTPSSWGPTLKYQLWVMGLLQSLALGGIVLLLRYRRAGLRLKLAAIVLATLLFSGMFCGVLMSYRPWHHSEWTIEQLVPDDGTVVETRYDYFSSLRPTAFVRNFSSAPMPVWLYPPENYPRRTSLIYHPQGWLVHQSPFPTQAFTVWRQQKCYLTAETIEFEEKDGRLRLGNHTASPLIDAVYLTASHFAVIGDLPVGRTCQIDWRSQCLPLYRRDNLPRYWRQTPALLPWLQANITVPAVVARTPARTTGTDASASQRRQRLLWFAVARPGEQK